MLELRQKGPRPKSLKQDDSIMATNNSSIVSKRSVERLYYPDERHFYRHFVKKPQRRAPLINRGYWLRMKAVDHVVHHFLLQPATKKKVVINLGSGYDPLPWQCFMRYPENCGNTLFIDIDYMDLMKTKRDVVKNTTELHEMLTGLSIHEETEVLLRSNQYVQIGCDLRQLSKLSTALAQVLDFHHCIVLFTAEVSITYMDVKAADALIKWAAGFPNAQFCLLEQQLPEGPDHPFAKTMIAHFEKLHTPLRSIQTYPTTEDQEQRFRDAGWKEVSARNLWQLWGSDDFLSPTERSSLNYVEPFDEWEEFAMFGCHYFLLVAKNEIHLDNCSVHSAVTPVGDQNSAISHVSVPVQISYVENSNVGGIRRFGASIFVRSANRHRDLIGNFAGMGQNSRLSSFDIYGASASLQSRSTQGFRSSPSSRMCHTISDLGDVGALLVGGRTSPDGGLADCWLYHKWMDSWERVDDLPSPRYRHSAAVIRGDMVLIIGGKSDSRTIHSTCLIWNRRMGWVSCSYDGKDMENGGTFGGTLAVLQNDSLAREPVKGILAGGMGSDGVIRRIVWSWTLTCVTDKPIIHFREWDIDNLSCTLIARFGASVVKHHDRVFVIGGIAINSVLAVDQEIISLSNFEGGEYSNSLAVSSIHTQIISSRPLLIGISASSAGHSLVLMGGGMVCFSFGTFWNKGCYTIEVHNGSTAKSSLSPKQTQEPKEEVWRYIRTIEPSSINAEPGTRFDSPAADHLRPATIAVIPRITINEEVDFGSILSAGRPIILGGLDLGSCKEAWTNEYLVHRIGGDRKIVVHQATSEHMDFATKNFDYVTKTFGEFMSAIEVGEKLYLRSLAVEEPSNLPADLSRDFPTISEDFRLPSELAFVAMNAHSSPLRISGPVNMWLHYDVMSNVLCQIRGSKRLLLFPPSDVRKFSFSPGTSSSSVDIFKMVNDERLAATHPYEALLNPGDILFLPCFWLHAASPTDGISVAVNVFFRSLKSGYAVGKDVYGNRDLQAYEKGRQDIAKIARSFDNVPVDVRTFYLHRLADELSQRAGLE